MLDFKSHTANRKYYARQFQFPSMLSSNSIYDATNNSYQCWINVCYPETSGQKHEFPLKIGFIKLTISKNSALSKEILFTNPKDLFTHCIPLPFSTRAFTGNPHRKCDFVKYSENQVICLIPKPVDSEFADSFTCVIRLAEIDEERRFVQVKPEHGNQKYFDHFPGFKNPTLYPSHSNQHVVLKSGAHAAGSEHSCRVFAGSMVVLELYTHTGNNVWKKIKMPDVFHRIVLEGRGMERHTYHFPVWISHNRLIPELWKIAVDYLCSVAHPHPETGLSITVIKANAKK